MLAIQRQSGNHEGTFFFSNLPTYLTWTTAWRKKSQEFLISERNLAKKNRDWLLNRARYERCRHIILHRRHSSIKV